MADLKNWYWNVAERPGEVYSSVSQSYVPDNDPTYQNWIYVPPEQARADGARSRRATRIATEAELFAEIKRRKRFELLPTTDPDRIAKEAVDADADASNMAENLKGKTPAQIRTYMTNNVTDIASAQEMFARIVIYLSRNT